MYYKYNVFKNKMKIIYFLFYDIFIFWYYYIKKLYRLGAILFYSYDNKTSIRLFQILLLFNSSDIAMFCTFW